MMLQIGDTIGALGGSLEYVGLNGGGNYLFSKNFAAGTWLICIGWNKTVTTQKTAYIDGVDVTGAVSEKGLFTVSTMIALTGAKSITFNTESGGPWQKGWALKVA